MKRTAGACILVAALGGCVSTDTGGPVAGCGGNCGGFASRGPSVPGAQGPWGQPVAMAAPYSAAPPGAEAARAMMARSMPLEVVQAGLLASAGGPSGVVQAGGQMVVPAPGAAGQPGAMTPPPGAVAAVGAITGAPSGNFPARRTEISFPAPHGMKISWYAPTGDGRGGFSANQIDAPGRYNFVQGGVYRLKLSNIPNRGFDLYPTLEVVPGNLKTEAFLSHSAVPITFTNEDFDQVAAGNYVVKVVYLPDPQFQDLATTGPDELVSSRLDPGVDPIAEAYRRGNILLVVRMGNINLELANSPAMDAPGSRNPANCPPGMGMMPGMPLNPNMAGMRGGVPAMPTSRMLMTPNGPMMTNPQGMPQMQMPQMPQMPTQQMQPPAGPVSRLPDLAPTQTSQTKYTPADQTASTPTASQPTTTASGMDKKVSEDKKSPRWWWPGNKE